MKVAVAYDNGKVAQDFENTHAYKLYTVEDGVLKAARLVGINGYGESALSGFLKHYDIDALICGETTQEVLDILLEKKIKLYGDVQGDSNEAVKKAVSGELE